MKDYNLEFRKLCAEDAMTSTTGAVNYVKNVDTIIDMVRNDYSELIRIGRIQDFFPPHEIIWKPDINKKIAHWSEVFEIK